MWGHAMTSGDGVIVFWEQVVGWGGIPCTARQGAPSARSTSYQQKSATASHRSANSGLWAAHWGVSAPPNMMASEPPTRATCAPAWWAATRPLGRAGCGGVLASGPQQGRSSPSTDCCFSETRLRVPKCPPKPVAHLIKSNTPGILEIRSRFVRDLSEIEPRLSRDSIPHPALHYQGCGCDGQVAIVEVTSDTS